MKNKKPDAAQIWKQLEDLLVPRLRLSITDRAVYSHLLRHSRLEGRARLRFSIAWLARGARLSTNPARWAVRRLIAHGALRLVERSKAGHVVEVRLPDEIRATRRRSIGRRGARPLSRGIDFEADFLKTRALRRAIHLRERGRCFYCLRRLTPLIRCLDHVVPRVSFGSNSYRNLVSCCLLCNSQKRDRSAGDFLRWLYRQRRLTAAELTARLRALDALAAGKLPPPLATTANSVPRKGRPPLHPANP
jgi:5-methylcytosine-specific restriction endonuclease McrA